MTYAELLRKIKTASAWYVGSFMSEFVEHYDRYCDDPVEKAKFIEYMYQEYDGGNTFESIRTKCYAVMSIVENRKVIEALEYVINGNDKKIEPETKTNAREFLKDIRANKVKLP